MFDDIVIDIPIWVLVLAIIFIALAFWGLSVQIVAWYRERKQKLIKVS